MPLLAPGITHIATSKTDNAYLIEGDDGLQQHVIALLHEPTRAVLVGDAVFHTGKLGFGPATYAAGPEARSSGAARIPVDVTAVGFGHGAPLSESAVDAFQAFLAKQR